MTTREEFQGWAVIVAIRVCETPRTNRGFLAEPLVHSSSTFVTLINCPHASSDVESSASLIFVSVDVCALPPHSIIARRISKPKDLSYFVHFLTHHKTISKSTNLSHLIIITVVVFSCISKIYQFYLTLAILVDYHKIIRIEITMSNTFIMTIC